MTVFKDMFVGGAGKKAKFRPGRSYRCTSRQVTPTSLIGAMRQLSSTGEIRKIKVAHFRLCHSRKFFVVAYFRETQEMVLDAHAKAFRYFGGTCKRGIYDNMSTAVTNILQGKEREYSQLVLLRCAAIIWSSLLPVRQALVGKKDR